MRWLRAWLIRLAGLLPNARRERELADEIEMHLQMHIEDNLRAGMSPDAARRDALMKLGGIEPTKQIWRERSGLPFFENLAQDARFAVRRLRKNPGFAAAAVVSIGLGIAANSTIFSMVSALLLRSAPVGDPATLMAVFTTHHGECCSNFSWLLYNDVRDQARSLSGVTAWFPVVPASIGGRGEPERVWGQSASANFFDVAQIRMALGRGFASDEEDRAVIVLGYGLWQRRFNGDPNIIGKAVDLSGRPFTVTGVAPPSFRGLEIPLKPEFWVPLGNLEQLMPTAIGDRNQRGGGWLSVAARLRPGVTPGEATAELNILGRRLAKAYPQTEKDRGFRLDLAGTLPLRYRSAVGMFLAALTVVVLLVLSIACANVANLLMAQAAARQREMAVRLAVGASSGRLLRQMLTESVLLALGGGAFGVALALWATRALAAFRLPVPMPIDFRVAVDGKVLAYTVALSAGAGMLFGLAPAWAAARPMLSRALKGEDVLGHPGGRWNLRDLLVVAQIATSLVLLCATGLFLRSMQNAAGIDTGLHARGVLTMAVDPRLGGYTAERTVEFLNQVRRRVAGLPGVTGTAFTDYLPLSMGGTSDGYHVEGGPHTSAADVFADVYMATGGYFEAMGIARVAGRDFAADPAGAPNVAVINEALAQRLFRNQNPLGQRITGSGATYQIIGVVKNIKSRTLGERVQPIVYRSLEQDLGRQPSLLGYTLLVRSAGNSASLTRAIEREIHTLDPSLAVFSIQTLEGHLRDALFLPRLAGTLFGIIGAAGLLLAAVGLYGVMSYTVSRRTREIGIRLALGADRGGVQRLIVRQGMLLAAAAMMVGLAAALAVAKLSAAFLYGVPPHDLVTFTAAPLFLAAIAFLACWIPSRRAAKVDPVTALRYE